MVVFSKITRFIYKNTQFFQTGSPVTYIKKAGNFPACDGPGPYGQPKEISDFYTLSIEQNNGKIKLKSIKNPQRFTGT